MLLECFTAAVIYGITPITEKHLLKFIEIESFILINGILIFLFCFVYWIFFGKYRLLEDIGTVLENKYLTVLILFTAFFVYIVANFFYMFAIKNNKTYMATALIACYPIITVLIGYIFLSEQISLVHIMGIICIILGVSLLTFFK